MYRTATARLSALAEAITTLGMGALFALFIYGIVMRHAFGIPQTWVDEAVTLLATWLIFWAGAFVLNWSDYISFDVVFRLVPEGGKRAMLIAGCLGFILVIGLSIYGIVDYIAFMKIMTTDMMRLRLDWVYSIFAVFLVGVTLRLAILAARLTFGDWRAVIASLDAAPQEDVL
ncbi:TRAP transporter small permease [Mesobacterium pallidum]|uniref:TRAP transporter small permease n=1 Tax=Mesobacterium pallidum TaxID=2872037 RepID=UPI001EE2218D|nr:TRAP transporter small permease subunit [Mesobacterium pallidum]